MGTGLIDIESWLADNPLRVWRHQTNTRMATICAFMGVSSTTIERWESGMRRPSGVTLGRLGALAEGSPFVYEWLQWEEQRPSA